MVYIQIVISLLTLSIAISGFVLTKEQKIAIQDFSETLALWFDDIRPLDWYIAIKSNLVNAIIGLFVILPVMAFFHRPIIEFSQPAREFSIEFYIVPLLVSVIINRGSSKFGGVMIALMSGEKEKYYGREFTPAQFFANGVDAISYLFVFSALSVASFYYLVAFPFQGVIPNDVVLIGAVLASLPIIWQLLMVVGIFIVLSALLLSAILMRACYLILHAVVWRVAIHQEGAWVAISLLIAILTGALSFFTINYGGSQ